MLATALIAEYPTAQAFARANPRRLAKLRYDGRHFVGPELADQLVAAAKRSVGQHHGPVYALQARHLCQDLDLWRRRLAEIERDIEGLLDAHEVGKLLLSIDGLGPHSAARIIAAVGDPARFKSAGAFAAYVGVVPHPYFAVTGKEGTFELQTVPPGTYTVEAWHEKLGRQTQTVTLGEKDSKDVTFTFKVGAPSQ